MEYEVLLGAAHGPKQLALEGVGKSCSRDGGVASRKKRFDLLQRLARVGQGLSLEHKNDCNGFEDAWGADMLKQYGAAGLKPSLGWCSNSRNALPVCMHAPGRTCFDGEARL